MLSENKHFTLAVTALLPPLTKEAICLRLAECRNKVAVTADLRIVLWERWDARRFTPLLVELTREGMVDQPAVLMAGKTVRCTRLLASLTDVEQRVSLSWHKPLTRQVGERASEGRPAPPRSASASARTNPTPIRALKGNGLPHVMHHHKNTGLPGCFSPPAWLWGSGLPCWHLTCVNFPLFSLPPPTAAQKLPS